MFRSSSSCSHSVRIRHAERSEGSLRRDSSVARLRGLPQNDTSGFPPAARALSHLEDKRRLGVVRQHATPHRSELTVAPLDSFLHRLFLFFAELEPRLGLGLLGLRRRFGGLHGRGRSLRLLRRLLRPRQARSQWHGQCRPAQRLRELPPADALHFVPLFANIVASRIWTLETPLAPAFRISIIVLRPCAARAYRIRRGVKSHWRDWP